MRSRRYLTVALGTVCAGLMLAQQYGPTRMEEQDQTLVRKIEAAGPKENLGVLQEVMRGLEERAVDPERYATVRGMAFAALLAKGTDDRNMLARLEQRYVLRALDRPDQVSALTELGLVSLLRPNVSSTEVASKDELRTKMDLLFHAWRRMEQDTKAGFDFTDEPAMNVQPPFGAGEALFSGMDPMGIKDPRLRAEYQAAIEKNRIKAEEFSRQFQLRNIKESFIRQAEGFLLSALRIDPEVEGAVFSSLSLVRDDEARERVLAKIRSRSDK